MSVTSQGPGWWQASDGMWYAPQPIQAPPPPRMAGPIGKDQSPAAVLGLSIVTIGIYFFVWYYRINKEIRTHDPDIAVSPGWCVVALFFPIANLISGYSTAARIRQMQLDDGATDTISPVVALLLQMFLGIGYPLYIASQLREHWHGHHRAEQPMTTSMSPPPTPT